MNKIEILIPNDKEIDWEASIQQKQIVLKNKQFTYTDMCKELFKNGYCYIDMCGNTKADGYNEMYLDKPNNATTRHQLECILAKNKLANCARYLNGEWKPTDRFECSYKINIHPDFHPSNLFVSKVQTFGETPSILFKSEQAAKQAIEILGE
jgi:hypothetical protein